MKTYESRVKQLESEGLPTSDAQGVADLELSKDTVSGNIYTVLSMAEWRLKECSKNGTYQHNSAALKNVRALIECAPELLEAAKKLLSLELQITNGHAWDECRELE